MCGRLNVTSDALCQEVSDYLGMSFSTGSNYDLCPSQTVATVVQTGTGYQQLNTLWGVQPSWSSKLLINAQCETVAQKKTFQQAIQRHRCLVPCSAWYEWRSENGKKQKYRFSHRDNGPLYMAGIYYQDSTARLITLTTKANPTCQAYHARMPMFILPENIGYWFNSPVEQLAPLYLPVAAELIKVTQANDSKRVNVAQGKLI
jgi:putative SOS response-associated peptidase YedK